MDIDDEIILERYSEAKVYLEQLSREINDEAPLLLIRFEDLVQYLPDIGEGPVGKISPKNIRAISILLEELGLHSEPRIHMGYVPRRYESSLVLFYLDHDIDFSSKEFKFAALILRVMVMMAQIDREILSEEEQEIKSLILNLSFLTTNEKRVLLAKSTCLFNDSLNGRLTFYDYTIQKI